MPVTGGVEITYLGAAGWLIAVADTRLALDPYFTRMSLWQAVTGFAQPDETAIRQYMPPADAILVTHPHFDHLMDVPLETAITLGAVYASPQGCDLLDALEVPGERTRVILPGNQVCIGPARITVFATPHRQIFGRIPFAGPLKPHLKPPLRASNYRMDFHYSFLIEADHLRILVASGIEHEPAVEADVLLFGADATPEQTARALKATRPRIVLPNHWDDMFSPLSAPVRPMIIPPPGVMPTLRRIDLAAFRQTVKTLSPRTRVILPERFRAYHLD